jgi:uncharacterized protein
MPANRARQMLPYLSSPPCAGGAGKEGPMQFNVAQQLKAPIGSIRSYRIEESLDLTPQDSCLLGGEVKLLRTNRGIMAQGGLQTKVEAECSRCLSMFHLPLRLEFEEEYSPISDVASGMASPGETGNFIIDKNHVLDLSDTVRQYILLATPMKPLCRAECIGLCPYCGQNLNQEPCRCTPEGKR